MKNSSVIKAQNLIIFRSQATKSEPLQQWKMLSTILTIKSRNFGYISNQKQLSTDAYHFIPKLRYHLQQLYKTPKVFVNGAYSSRRLPLQIRSLNFKCDGFRRLSPDFLHQNLLKPCLRISFALSLPSFGLRLVQVMRTQSKLHAGCCSRIVACIQFLIRKVAFLYPIFIFPLIYIRHANKIKLFMEWWQNQGFIYLHWSTHENKQIQQQFASKQYFVDQKASQELVTSMMTITVEK